MKLLYAFLLVGSIATTAYWYKQAAELQQANQWFIDYVRQSPKVLYITVDDKTRIYQLQANSHEL